MRNLQWRWMLADTFAWLVGSVIAAELRFEFVASQFVLSRYILVGLTCAILQISIGLLFGHYRGRFRSGSFDDFRATCINPAIASVLCTIVVLFARPQSIPRPVAITCGVIAVTIMLAARLIHRNLRERLISESAGATPVILFGAGDAGEQIARATRRDPRSNYQAVAFLDDSPKRQNLRLEGIDVRGTRFDLEKVAAQTGARTLIVTIARANARLINDLSERCAAADIHMLVLPPVSQLVSGGVGLGDVREVNEADLLGRAVVQTDTASISDLLHGRRVLITGAGGSIGAEIARKVHPFGPSQLVLLDRDESALHAVQLSIHGRPNLSSDELVLADIRDAERLDEIFAHVKPEIVFHAAALKHLPLLEKAPMEAIKSNIGGTQNVLAAAEKHGVDAFINISTDKAANPTSVLGFSKRITERVTAEADTRNPGRYLSVRFGNVLGSRGSMLSVFSSQIAGGGPVTVTHPDITRYFMTIPEAVLLVLQASVVGRGGEVLILDMGEPIRIADVAERLIRHSGRPVDIVFTGLSDGEKLHEDLLSIGEDGTRPFHPKITHVPVEPLRPIPQTTVPVGDTESLRVWLAKTAASSEDSMSIECGTDCDLVPRHREGSPALRGNPTNPLDEARRQ